MAGTAISYNLFSLNDNNYITSEIQDSQTPDRDLSLFNLARNNGAVITNSVYHTKTIRVSGRIVDTTFTAVESRSDALNAAMAAQDKNLDIAYNGGTRRYVATPAVISISRPVRAAPWGEYSIDFLVTEYGKDTASTTLFSGTTVTTSGQSVAVTFGGSAPEQPPIITITITSATFAATNFITVTNPANGQAITLTRLMSAGQVITFDCDAKTVKVGSTLVDYSGYFPQYAPGVGSMVFTTNLTSFSLSTGATYVKRYL